VTPIKLIDKVILTLIIQVDFVGPWVGTRPPDPAGPPVPPPLQNAPPPDDTPTQNTTGGYAVGADPNFGSDHFSAWGRQLAQQKSLINGMIMTYQPEYLLVLLGFNDIGWFISDAQGTFESMQNFIDEARAAKPDIKFALGNIPQRTFIGGRDDLPIKTDVYNQILAAAIPWLSMYIL
jgi:lysophospholipase L1-like esterase